MSDEQRALLEAERERTRSQLVGLTRDFDAVVEASLDSNADDEHDPDGSTIAFERSQLDSLMDQARHHLLEIDAALERVDAGAYGTCETCGQPIAIERLRARPVARQCIRCASADRR